MKCPKCGERMIQFPHNKLMINCPICETVMRNPRHLEQTSIEDGKVTKWHNTKNPTEVKKE